MQMRRCQPSEMRSRKAMAGHATDPQAALDTRAVSGLVFLYSVDSQPPTNRATARAVLFMVLWRQRVAGIRSNLIATVFAAIDA